MTDSTIQLSTNIGTGDELFVDLLAGGEKCEYVKLLDSTAGSETRVGVAANGVAANAMRVTIASDSDGVVGLNTGTNSVGTVGLNTGTNAIGSIKAAGAVAHDAAGTSILPLLQGGIAMEMDGTTLDPVAVAASDLTYMRTDRDGRQLTNASHPASGSYNLETSSAQTATECVAQPGAGFSVYITGLYCSAITAQTLWIHDEDDTVLIPLQYFGANTGTVRIDLSSNPAKVTAVKAVEVTSTAGIAHSVLLQYYIAP
jgi:hypothetical protein